MRSKFKGVRLVGDYHIPYREAAAYERRVERCRGAALSAMRAFCPYALPQWKGGQDGEAVMGLDRKGELIALIHLDSEGMDLIDRDQRDGSLIQALKDYNKNPEAEKPARRKKGTGA